VPVPTISTYPMPAAADLPPSRVHWRVQPDRAALLIHDMQQYFVDFLPSGASPTTQLLANTAVLKRWAVSAGMPVYYTAQPAAMTQQERGLLRDLWGDGMARTPGGNTIVPDLMPTGSDTVLSKWRYSAFHRSNLEALLLQDGRDQLVLCGVYAHVGVLVTAVEAFSRDIQPFVVADAVADFGPAEHRMALEFAAECCAQIVLTDHLIGALSADVEEATAGMAG
jgi:trans-2,3-dihydro-3-hydroxyanthranilic acid synthase